MTPLADFDAVGEMNHHTKKYAPDPVRSLCAVAHTATTLKDKIRQALRMFTYASCDARVFVRALVDPDDKDSR
jgi:hypothetical protein